MSWDVIIVNAQGVPANLQSLPEDFEPEPMGDREHVRELITSVLPNADWSDPSWGLFEGDGFTIEFSIGDEEPVGDVMLHVRGSGDPLPTVVEICKRGSWLAFDTTQDAAIDLNNPSRAGWEAFSQFRDQAMAQIQSGELSEATENGASGADATLPDSDLSIQNGKLVERFNGEIVESYALSDIRQLRFGTGLRLEQSIIAGVGIALAAASKIWISTSWLSWILTVIFGLLSIPFLLNVYGDTVRFMSGGKDRNYSLFGAKDDVEVFRSALRQTHEAARRRR